MGKRIVGISPWSPKDGTADYDLMMEAGIEWVREEIGFPYGEGGPDDTPKEYLEKLARYKRVHDKGMHVACVSPFPGGYNFRKELGRPDFYRCIPQWMGEYDTDEFYDNVYKMSRRIGEDTRGIVELWQVGNEMDEVVFRGRMTIEQAARYLKAMAEGLRAGSPDALLGINPARYETDDAQLLYRKLYVESPGLLDYVGFDRYFGTHQPGKVQDLVEVIDILHEMTGKQVLCNEWGYNSAGGEAWPDGDGPCQCGHWKYVWHKEHSEAEQAEYVATGTRLLLTYPNCMGFLYYSWGDDGYCWVCGKEGCPGESTWGITDGHNNPKPAYYALKENVLKYNR